GIVIKPWDPETPYMTELKAAGKEKAFVVYLKNRAEYGTSPAFFLDCADFFSEQGDPQLALQVLSNIAELELENPALLRVLAHRLAQTGNLDLAVLAFEEVLWLWPEEPQSYRDLALVLVRRAEETLARTEARGLDRPLKKGATAGLPSSAVQIVPKITAGQASSGTQIAKGLLLQRAVKAEAVHEMEGSVRNDYARAVELLYEVVLGEWDERFTEIEVIALVELNRILPKAKAAGVKEIAVDKRLIELLDVDVRIVMTWHADNTDIDLWVIEPSGEKAFYGHDRTTIGGLVSQDFTGGYGPEEYLVRRAQGGTYKIQANYYGSQATRLLGAVTVQVDVFTNFGREGQQRKSITVRLKEPDETATIGEIEF
ncbi:MAG: DUF2135 domain-containing protein, partial [Planctomycetota bacterium]